jgi:dolichol-phosphate mannosyltransferase
LPTPPVPFFEPDLPAPVDPSGRTLVIVPTYNEADNIEPLARQVLNLPGEYDLLVVDDGSPDGTSERVRALVQTYPRRVHLIERSGKLGLGTAYVAGFRFALSHGYLYICQMDADFSHNPSDLPRLVSAVQDGADLAVGSRYVGGVRVLNWPLTRLILSYGAGIYTRSITRMPICDVTAGFKCFHRRTLESLDLQRVRSNGYAFQVEMTYRAWKRGFHIVEIPITFTERTEGQSKMSGGIVNEAAWKVWELRFRALVGRL